MQPGSDSVDQGGPHAHSAKRVHMQGRASGRACLRACTGRVEYISQVGQHRQAPAGARARIVCGRFCCFCSDVRPFLRAHLARVLSDRCKNPLSVSYARFTNKAIFCANVLKCIHLACDMCVFPT